MITDEMLSEAARKAAIRINDSLPVPAECDHQFSAKFDRRMKKLIHLSNHPIRYRLLRSAAMIALVLFLGFGSVLSVSVEARETAFLLNKLAKLDKADGFMINFLKILFRILTFLYGYYSVGSLVGLLKNWLNPSELYLPSSVNPWKLWLFYTAAYLMLCAIHTMLLKLIRIVKKRNKKTVAK